MVRVAEGPAAAQLAFAEIARQRAHHRGLQRLLRFQGWQDARQARRQHRLARAGRPDHQEIVAARRRHLEHALGALLALDLGEVGVARAILGDQRLGNCEPLLAAQVIDQGEQRGRGDDRRPIGICVVEATPRGLAAAHRGTDHAAPRRAGGDRRRQHAGHAAERAVERQLAQHDVARDAFARHHAHRR
jgi:hypothetical protein